MNTLDAYNPTSSTALLLVGLPGAGKTTIALQFPRPYLFDADNNLAGPARTAPSLGVDLSKVKYDIGNFKADGTVIPPFLRYTEMTKRVLAACSDPDIDTIVLDSLTTITDYMMDDIKRQRKIAESKRMDYKFEFDDWALLIHYYKNLVTELRTSGKIIIFTAHEAMKKDDVDGAFRTFLAIPGASRDTLAGLFSDAWNPTVKQKGFGAQAKAERTINTLPVSGTDKRGLKASLDLPPNFPATDLPKYLKPLFKSA